MTTLEELKTMVNEMKSEINDMKSSMGTKEKKPKVPRKPSEFNLFMKTKITEMKEKHPNVSHSEAFKMAAGEWKNRPQPVIAK